MKKLFLALMAVAAIALTGCEKKSDGTSGGTSEKVKTISATDITSSGALLTGQIGVEIADYKSIDDFGMLISEKESDVSSYNGKKLVGDKLIGQIFSVTANGLSAETQYYYRAYLMLNNMQYEYGDIKSFKTEKLKVKTISATDITSCGALLTGQIDVEISDYKSIEFGILISEKEFDVSSYEGKKLVGDKLISQTFSITANGLSAETKYYYRAYLILNNMQYEYGDIKSFKTEKGGTGDNHQYVDLGLSVKWANMNVGATVPEGYGDNFAWGETEPKEVYNWSTYKYCSNGGWTGMTKYTYPDGQKECIWYNGDTFIGDNKTTLDPKDDAAHVNWGGNWRMPTKEELSELKTKCTWTWTQKNGINGYEVKGPNGNSIFLPASGCRGGSSLYLVDSYGYYWSSSLRSVDSRDAFFLGFSSGGVFLHTFNRYYGQSVRPVCQ